MAQVHFVVRPPEGELIAEVDTQELERRLADAARSWRDDLVAADHAPTSARSGAPAWRGPTLDAFPEAYKEDFPARTGVGRPRPARGARARARRQRHRPVPLRDGRRRPRRGAAQGLPGRVAALALRGAADALVDGRRGGRRAALRARRLDRPTYIYDFGLRYTGRAQSARTRARPRAVPGRAARGLGRAQRDRRLQRAWCSAPG